MTFPRHIFATLFVVFAACNAYAEQYQGLQLSTRDITTLAALKVTPEYVKEMRAYFPHISAKDITSLYALKVKPNYLRDMRAHFPNMSVKDVTSLYALKVTPEYIKEMRAYFPNISVKDITSLYALKVPPGYVKEIHDLGYADISTREITRFYALKVKPEYIKQMRAAGGAVPTVSDVPKIPAVPAMPVIAKAERQHNISWFDIFVGMVSGAVLIMILRSYYLHRQRVDEVNDREMNDRITDFEGRVNDLQDILLSIDDRLDRRIHQS